MKANYLFKRIFSIPTLIGCLILSISCDRGDDYKREDGDGNLLEETERSDNQETDIRANQSSNATGEEYDEQDAMYPEEKVLDETNLDSDKPMETGTAISLIEKHELLASLIRQKTAILYHIEELFRQSQSQDTTPVVRGTADKLRVYLEKLDDEITKVRAANPNDMQQVGESAQAAIKASGALMQSSVMRIDRGF